MHAFVNGKSLLGISDRVVKQIFPGKFAEALMHLIPALHRARNRDGMDPILRHALEVVLRQKRRRQRARRGTGGIQASQLSCLCVPIHDEKIAAHARHHWLGDAEDRVRCDGRIHRRSAARQNLRTRLRRQNLARGRDALLADHDGAAVIAAEHLRVQDRHG